MKKQISRKKDTKHQFILKCIGTIQELIHENEGLREELEEVQYELSMYGYKVDTEPK